MLPKNLGPCVIVEGCESHAPFRKFTETAKNNAIINETYKTYSYLQVDDQLCQSHYLSIVVPYKRGVTLNVKSYMNRLEKDNATHNNLLLHEESNKENNDNDEVNENDKVLLAFKNALDSIKTW